MKINETFGPPSDHDVVDESRRVESEVLTQLKSEFLEFVTQTRERLRLVSESLSELDREYTVQPPIIDQPVSVPEQLEAEPIIETDGTPIQSETPESVVESGPVVDNDEPSDAVDFWGEAPTDSETQPSMTEDASNDATFPSAGELDSDPMERLNAIKKRLARQIENS